MADYAKMSISALENLTKELKRQELVSEPKKRKKRTVVQESSSSLHTNESYYEEEEVKKPATVDIESIDVSIRSMREFFLSKLDFGNI